MNINDYGIMPNTQNLPGIPARVTAVHKERYEIVCAHGTTHARLKTKEYKEESIDKAEMLSRKQQWSKGVAKFTKQRKKEIW